MDALGTLIFVLIFIVAIVRMIKQAVKGPPQRPEEKGRTYQASQEDIQTILRQLGLAPKEPPQQPGAPAGQRPSAAPRTAAPGGIVPDSPTWPPRSERPQVRPAVKDVTQRETGQPAGTRRLVPEEEHLAPTIEAHLRERRLAEGETPLVPTVAGHLQERHLASDQLSLQPTIEDHLKAVHMEETPEMQALAAGQRRRVGIGRVRRIATRAAGTQPRERHFSIPTIDVRGVRQAIVLSEILRPPLALRQPLDSR